MNKTIEEKNERQAYATGALLVSEAVDDLIEFPVVRRGRCVRGVFGVDYEVQAGSFRTCRILRCTIDQRPKRMHEHDTFCGSPVRHQKGHRNAMLFLLTTFYHDPCTGERQGQRRSSAKQM